MVRMTCLSSNQESKWGKTDACRKASLYVQDGNLKVDALQQHKTTPTATPVIQEQETKATVPAVSLILDDRRLETQFPAFC